MKKLLVFLIVFFFLNMTLSAQDVTGTWERSGVYKAELFQDGQNIHGIYNIGNFKHYLSGRFISANQIEAQVVRIDVNNNNCRTVLTFRYTLNGNTLTGSWTANDGNCDLQRGHGGNEEITRTTASPRPMNPFGGTAFNPANDVTGSWSWEDDWFQDTNGNVYYIANGNGYKQFFRGTRSGNRITGELIRYNPSGCRMILNQTFTQTDANTMQYTWVGVGNCDVVNGQRGSGTILRATARRTNFDPALHGFRFRNDFVTNFAGIDFSGLCGGMAYSALDYFNHNIPVPTQTSTPANGTPLRQYIYDRQQNSTLDNLDKWAELSVNPFGWRTGEFFNWGLQGFNGGRLQELRAEIDNGRPVPLGLYKGGNGGFVTHHQVLAIGYDLGRYTGDLGQNKEDLKIYVYDSNFPSSTMTLVPNLGNATYYYVEAPHCSWLTYFVDKKYRLAMPPR